MDTVRQDAGIKRAYRYRKSLPYNPRAGAPRFPNTPANIKLSERTQSRFDTLPEPVQVTILSRYGKLSPRFVDESLAPKQLPAMPLPSPPTKGGKRKGSTRKKS
jgi:hypothetical protein